MRTVVFVVGPSGVGKTTLVRHLLGRSTTLERWTVGSSWAAAGPYTGATLDGPDLLPRSMAVVESMLDRLDAVLPVGMPVLLDGQRFGAWAIARLKGKARRVVVVLQAPVPVLLTRRAARGSSGLMASALEAQAREAQAIAANGDACVMLDATQPVSLIAAAVWRCR